MSRKIIGNTVGTTLNPKKIGGTGGSGVYVGSGEMPDGYNIQIDPSGEVDGYYTSKEIDAMFGTYITDVAELVDEGLALVGGDS